MPRRNPLDPDAHARDPHPTALPGPDDRRGVHTTPDKLTAIWYAMVKASHSSLADNDTGVLLLLDTKGLEAHTDYDAVVERKNTYLHDLAYAVAGEFALDPESESDRDRLIDLIRGAVENFDYTEDPIKAGDSVLVTIPYALMQRGEGNQLILSTLLEKAENSADDAGEIIEVLSKYYRSKDLEDLPLEWFAYALQQWRYFVPIGFDRVVRVEIVRPWDDYLREDYEDEASSELPVFALDDFYAGSLNEGSFETLTVYEKATHPGARLEWHGTNLSRAREAFPRLARKIANPWNFPFRVV